MDKLRSERVLKHLRTFLGERLLCFSLSCEFICYIEKRNTDRHPIISRTPEYVGGVLYPIAYIINNDIKGVEGNTGNRFNRLSDIEKVDCVTILNSVRNQEDNPQ